MLSCYLFAFLCVGFDLEGFCVVLDAFFCYLDEFFEGFSWGCVWHYSPLDREEVAMYRGRALVGPQWCRVSFHGERREKGYGVWAPTGHHIPC